MAGMFYSQKEAAEKLGVNSEQIKELVEQGKLREFRDGANILFKITEVEALVGKIDIPESASSAGDDELFFAAEDSEPQDSAGQEELLPIDENEPIEDKGLASDDDLSLSLEGDTGSELDLSNADTKVPDEGINVLGETDSGLKNIDDTMGETAALDIPGSGAGTDALGGDAEGDVNLDTFGSGSGLLDLSLQADDTSLGGILDEIYTPEQGAVEPAQAEAAASGAIPTEAMAAEAEMIADVGLAAQPQATIIQGYIEPELDASNKWFGMMLFLSFIAVIYTAIVAFSGLFNIMPAVLAQTRGIILYILGGLLVFAFILMIIGLMSGSSAKPRAKKERMPKVKKEKPKKEKKAKK
jgi:excisionase family DNA binding protein